MTIVKTLWNDKNYQELMALDHEVKKNQLALVGQTSKYIKNFNRLMNGVSKKITKVDTINNFEFYVSQKGMTKRYYDPKYASDRKRKVVGFNDIKTYIVTDEFISKFSALFDGKGTQQYYVGILKDYQQSQANLQRVIPEAWAMHLSPVHLVSIRDDGLEMGVSFNDIKVDILDKDGGLAKYEVSSLGMSASGISIRLRNTNNGMVVVSQSNLMGILAVMEQDWNSFLTEIRHFAEIVAKVLKTFEESNQEIENKYRHIFVADKI